MRGPRWQFGLGRENGLAFWGVTFLEACFGSFFALWPLWIEELGASIALVGWLLGLGGILRLFTISASAGMARRHGVKHVLIGCRLIATAGILWAAFAQHWWWLFPAQVGMATGEMAFPLVSTNIAMNAGANRVRAFAIILTVGGSISLMVTPLISGGLVAVWGLRAPFVAAAVFSLVSVGFFSRFQTDRPSAGEASASAEHGGYRELARIPGLPALMTLQFTTFLALGMGTSLLSNYLHDQAGYSEARVATLTALTAIGSITFAVIVARHPWFSRHPLKSVAIGVASAGIAYILFLQPDFLPFVLVGLVLRGGFFTSWPLFTAVLGEASPEAMRGHAYAAGEILAGTGFVCAPVFAGVLYEISPRLPLLVAVGMIAPLVVILARYRPPHPHDATPDVDLDISGAMEVAATGRS